MTVAHPVESVRNGIADHVVGQLNGGSLVFYQADGTTEVATLPFTNNPAFNAAVGGVAAADGLNSDVSALAGITTVAKLLSSTSAVIVTCSVGMTGTEDIVLSSNDIDLDDTVAVSSLTYAAPD